MTLWDTHILLPQPMLDKKVVQISESFVFWDGISLCNLCSPRTHSVDQVGLKLKRFNCLCTPEYWDRRCVELLPDLKVVLKCGGTSLIPDVWGHPKVCSEIVLRKKKAQIWKGWLGFCKPLKLNSEYLHQITHHTCDSSARELSASSWPLQALFPAQTSTEI